MTTFPRPVVVVLPAAGKGERFKSSVPKQFTEINRQPLILHTLKALQRINWIQKIYLAISDEWSDFVLNLIIQNTLSKVELVKGGETRHSSIKKCVDAIAAESELGSTVDLKTEDSAIVIVHDAVRPFVDEETYHSVATAALNHQASGAICGLVSTVLSVTEDGFLDQALNRSVHAASHTPQAFTLDVLRAAYENISEEDLAKGTECLDLAWKHCRVKVKLVPAPDEVWKVTYHKDTFAAEALAREQSIKAMVICQEGKTELSEAICQQLSSRKLEVKFGESISDISKSSEEVNSLVLILSYSYKEGIDIQESFRKIDTTFDLLKDFGSSMTVVFNFSFVPSQEDHNCLNGLARRSRLDKEESGDEDGKLMHFIIWHESLENDVSKGISRVSELVASLVFDKNPVMNGQVLTLP